MVATVGGVAVADLAVVVFAIADREWPRGAGQSCPAPRP
jgi:hypothetical protein